MVTGAVGSRLDLGFHYSPPPLSSPVWRRRLSAVASVGINLPYPGRCGLTDRHHAWPWTLTKAGAFLGGLCIRVRCSGEGCLTWRAEVYIVRGDSCLMLAGRKEMAATEVGLDLSHLRRCGQTEAPLPLGDTVPGPNSL